MSQIWENVKVLPLIVLDIIPSYHSREFARKLMNHTSENGEKPNIGHNFVPLIFLLCYLY